MTHFKIGDKVAYANQEFYGKLVKLYDVGTVVKIGKRRISTSNGKSYSPKSLVIKTDKK